MLKNDRKSYWTLLGLQTQAMIVTLLVRNMSASIIVPCGCHNKLPQPGQLKKNGNLFSQFWRPELSLVLSAKAIFPNKVTFTVCRDEEVDVHFGGHHLTYYRHEEGLCSLNLCCRLFLVVSAFSSVVSTSDLGLLSCGKFSYFLLSLFLSIYS